MRWQSSIGRRRRPRSAIDASSSSSPQPRQRSSARRCETARHYMAAVYPATHLCHTLATPIRAPSTGYLVHCRNNASLLPRAQCVTIQDFPAVQVYGAWGPKAASMNGIFDAVDEVQCINICASRGVSRPPSSPLVVAGVLWDASVSETYGHRCVDRIQRPSKELAGHITSCYFSIIICC